MKILLHCRWLFVLLALFGGGRAVAAESAATLLGAVQQQVEALKTLPLEPAVREELARLWRDMGGDLSQLQDLLAQVTVSDQFAESLKANAEALRVVLDAQTPAKRKLEICRGVERDLDAKASAVRASTIDGRGRDLAVTAYTLAGGREIAGCEVWFVPEAWKDERTRHRRFQRVSSPTAAELAPGYYLFWTRRNNKDGARVPITVSSGGRIDVPVP